MKKFILLLLTAALCIGAAGCASILEGEMLYVEPYRDEVPDKVDGAMQVRSYTALKNAIISLVGLHEEEGTLAFPGYSGDLEEDLPRAFSEVKTENAMCAYAMDYISYDLRQIVSYYEAHLYINYKRSAEQIQQVQGIGAVSNMAGALREALYAGQGELALRATGTALREENIQELARQSYYAEPLRCVRLPQISVSVYPETGVTRIYEIRMDYGESEDALQQRLTALHTEVDALMELVPRENETLAASALSELLAARCVPAETETVYAKTAYGVLVEGEARGEGYAMAYKAVCDKLGLDCVVVSGRRDREAHAWNIVCVDGRYCHVDASAEDAAVLHNDDEMWGRYWWDIDLYPDCEGLAPPPEETPGENSPGETPAPVTPPEESQPPVPEGSAPVQLSE